MRIIRTVRIMNKMYLTDKIDRMVMITDQKVNLQGWGWGEGTVDVIIVIGSKSI